MTHAARDWARRQRVGSTTASYILRDLADRADNAHQCFPNVTRIAEDCEMSTRAVKAGIALLEELGLISRQRRYTGYQDRTSDLYTLHLDIEVRNTKAKGKPRGRSAPRSGAESAPNAPQPTAPVGANSAHTGTPGRVVCRCRVCTASRCRVCSAVCRICTCINGRTPPLTPSHRQLTR